MAVRAGAAPKCCSLYKLDGDVYLDESNLGWNSSHHIIPDLNDQGESDDDIENERSLFEDDEDEDYVPEGKEENIESEGESNLYNGGIQMNMALFAEWTAWVHEEGRMQKILEMMYPEVNEDEPEIDDDT